MIRLFSQKAEFATENGLVTPRNKNLYWAFGLVAGSWMICLLISFVVSLVSQTNTIKPVEVTAPKLSQFTSESEFRSYLTNKNQPREIPISGGAPAELDMKATANDQAERYSDTNVQVKGIDEPDIVKTDGKRIYFSSQDRYFINPIEPMTRSGSLPRTRSIANIIQAKPIDTIKKLATIDRGGELLVTNDRLMVIAAKTISGFNISQPESPKLVWEYEFEGNRQIESIRLVEDKILVVSKLPVYQSSPCPLPLGKNATTTMTIACTDIWHPEKQTGANTTYTVMKIDAKNGEVEDTLSLVGYNSQTVVYVSNKALYITFSEALYRDEIMVKVLLNPESVLVDENIKERLQQVMDLDISQPAKQVEVNQIINGYTVGFNDDDRLKWQAEINNRIDEYREQHQREIETTTIAKINLANWEIEATGIVPGRPLNQFSLDEYQDHLRLATSVGQKANDVYVLDDKLNQTGKITDLGLNERIYAVRFLGDRGFVVTFKDTDPLYALDLSTHAEPKVGGELKIPGYSSYLHPLTNDLLVGIGKEDNQVKISLFDVSDMSKPTELDKYQLPDYWSEILSTHHAFLQDSKHQVMFIPASNGGYIFSYADNKLKLERAVAGKQVKRALYISDYLYLVSQDEIEVLNETNWQTVKTVGL